MAGVKILLIDDDPGVVRALGAALRREGYEILTALDAVQATMFARREMPALILLDLGLPAGDGLHVLEVLSRQASTAAIPVVVLTGSSDPEKLARARELGASDCFVKGPDLAGLMARVRALAGPARPGSADAAPPTPPTPL